MIGLRQRDDLRVLRPRLQGMVTRSSAHADMSKAAAYSSDALASEKDGARMSRRRIETAMGN